MAATEEIGPPSSPRSEGEARTERARFEETKIRASRSADAGFGSAREVSERFTALRAIKFVIENTEVDEPEDFAHSVGMAWALWDVGGVRDPDTINAALLYDLVATGDMTPAKLVPQFGAEVAMILQDAVPARTPRDPFYVRMFRERIKNALFISKKAKLVALADILCTCERLQASPWVADELPGDRKEVQGFFVWARAVAMNLWRVSPAMKKALEDVFEGTFPQEGVQCPVIPQGVGLVAFLEDYLCRLERGATGAGSSAGESSEAAP